MDYTSDPDSNTKPNLHDYAQLETIYSHDDASTGVDVSVCSGGGDGGGGGGGTNCRGKSNNCDRMLTPQDDEDEDEGPSAWGHLVSKNAQSSTYELTLGVGPDGEPIKKVTHVYWA
jgi:hypothetical protein